MSNPLVDFVNQKSSGASHDIFESIHAVMHLFRAEQYRVLRDGPHDLTHMEGKILAFFARNPGAILSDLVAHAGRDKGQLARLIKNLKRKGLLGAQKNAKDRRSVRLQLTKDGLAVHKALQRQVGRLEKVAVMDFNMKERQQLATLLDRVKANLKRP
jgi:DNA-binding MarR family transcriptional regulator